MSQDEQDLVAKRYDEFQKPAVKQIVSDFHAKPNGRYLLVIPTGGGKTFTAVKAVTEIFIDGTLSSGKGEKVLWIAHREELVKQAAKTFKKYWEKIEDDSLKNNIEICMLSDMAGKLKSDDDIRLLVIDEAHHAEAPTYLPAFDYEDLGILGLTATPTRHDGRPLRFERESYSIGFPDLVQRRIVLRPEVIKVEGGSYDTISDLNDTSGLEALNNDYRNKQIIESLISGKDKYSKIIVFVGTVAHVATLYDAIKNSSLDEHYDSISWITGMGNNLDLDREKFIEREQSLRRSIIINVDVLTEGYDDPSVDTIVMARPTKSKLVYMQAMGRGIRRDPDNPTKKSYLIEVEDNLPNIQYRIDNRWLYSDVSDALEPAVLDIEISSAEHFKHVVNQLFAEYSVNEDFAKEIPAFDPEQRVSLLLFQSYVNQNTFQAIPVFLTPESRHFIANTFNFLSENMRANKTSNVDAEVALRRANFRSEDFGDSIRRRLIYEAMSNSVGIDDFEKRGMPWITYVGFHYRAPAIPDDLIEFCRDMVNKEDITTSLLDGDFISTDVLMRIPLPLSGDIGLFIDAETFVKIAQMIKDLESIKSNDGKKDHYFIAKQFGEQTTLPLPSRYYEGLVSAVRTDYNCCYNLSALTEIV